MVLLVGEQVGAGVQGLPGGYTQASDIFLTALAALLTLIYAVGLLFRPSRRVAGMGIDSLVVLVVYAVGVVGLFAIS